MNISNEFKVELMLLINLKQKQKSLIFTNFVYFFCKIKISFNLCTRLRSGWGILKIIHEGSILFGKIILFFLFSLFEKPMKNIQYCEN